MKHYSNSLGVLLGVTLAFSMCAAAAEVVIEPGTVISEAVAGNPPGTTFRLRPGVYRNEDIVPKDGDQFIGDAGATLNGSRLLTFQPESGLWVAHQQTQHLPTHGSCMPDHPMCSASEDLFFDNKPLLRVASRDQLGPGRWYFDYGSQSIYVADDPSNHVVETSLLTTAFRGNAARVVIDGLIIEKYGSPAQNGAVGGKDHPEGWVIRNNEIRLNHGDGLHVSTSAQVKSNRIHDNGHKGVGCSMASNVVIDSNEIAFNGYAGFQRVWEAGGLKCTFTEGIILRNNVVHDNIGPGLWLDTDNEHALYEKNRVYNNTDSGIQHEISFDAVIRDNQVWNNGDSKSTWLWRSQILIQNSQKVEVYGNSVLVTPGHGNGIGIIQQNRKFSDRMKVPYIAQDNYVHDNDVTYLAGADRTSGLVGDFATDKLYGAGNAGNRFENNHYHLGDPRCECFRWNGKTVPFPAFQAMGQDTHGSADHNTASRAAFRP